MNYKQLAQSISKRRVSVVGNFYPITIIHELIVKSARVIASQESIPLTVFVDNTKSTFSAKDTISHLSTIFPDLSIEPLIEYPKNSILVYSGNKPKWVTGESVCVGTKPQDGDSSQLKSITKGDFYEFYAKLPSSILELDARRLYNDYRKSLRLDTIHVSVEPSEVREQYFNKQIFLLGEKVQFGESCGIIKKRGTNHVLVDIGTARLESVWITDLKYPK